MSFKGISDIKNSTNKEMLKSNIKYWLDESFLNIGAFFNVSIPTSGLYSNSYHKLFPIKEPGFANGKVWKTFHTNLVWESGINYSTEPIKISGVYVNNTFMQPDIDYNLGKVYFSSVIPANSSVMMEYSYKWINIVPADNSDWFLDITTPYHINEKNTVLSSGDLSWNRLQLPTIIYEFVDRKNRPYALGGGQWCETDIIFHVLTEDRYGADKISEILADQDDKTIYTFDVNKMYSSGVYGLNYNGTLNEKALTYNNLINDGYRNGKLTFHLNSAQRTNKLNNGLYHTPVRFKTDVIRMDI